MSSTETFGVVVLAILGAIMLIWWSENARKVPADPEALTVGNRTFTISDAMQQNVARVVEQAKVNDDPMHILFEIGNSELRQSMIKQFGGFEALIAKVQHDILHTDDYGTLFRVWVPKLSKHFYYVKVINGTAEPDGSHREYYLEVPPDMDTAKEAVAWTYGLHPDDYHIAVRT